MLFSQHQRATLFLFLTLFAHLQSTEDSSFFTKMQRQNMSTIEWEEQDWPNEGFTAFLERCREYQHNPQLFRKRKTAFTIVEPHHQPVDLATQLDGQTMCDLELFRGEVDTAHYLGDTLDRTHTQLGRVNFLSLLEPTVDQDLLITRQETIRYLLEHEELYQGLTDALSALAEHEPVLFSFWYNDPLKQVNAPNYYKFHIGKMNEYFNGNPISLGIRGTFLHQQRLMWVGTLTLATVVLPVLGIYTICDKESPSWLSTVGERLRGSGGPLLSLVSLIENSWVKGLSAIAGGVYCGLAAKSTYNWFTAQFLLQRIIQEKLISASLFFKQLKHIEALTKEHPLLLSNLPALKELTALYQNPATEQLLTLLEAPTFKGEPSNISHQGNILLAYRLLDELKQECEPALTAMGKLDAYHSIATLYKEHTFCFAEYIDQDTP